MRLIIGVLALVALTSCTKKSESDSNIQETAAHQVGDVMASIDESGGSSGTFAMMTRERQMFARMAPMVKEKQSLLSSLLPDAHAGSCQLSSTWGSCVNNRVIRDFNDCTVFGFTFRGIVTFDFDDGTVNNICTVDSDGDTITRDPNFTITGPLGRGVYSVSKTGAIGQRITRTAVGVFNFTNDGIRRSVTYNGRTVADFTTTTTSAIGITGTVRNGRVVSGGTLHVVNNVTGVSCDFSPTAVTWGGTCNCPVSGSWTGSCTTGGSASINITGCGTGTLTVGGSTDSVTFDRCNAI